MTPSRPLSSLLVVYGSCTQPCFINHILAAQLSGTPPPYSLAELPRHVHSGRHLHLHHDDDSRESMIENTACSGRLVISETKKGTRIILLFFASLGAVLVYRSRVDKAVHEQQELGTLFPPSLRFFFAGMGMDSPHGIFFNLDWPSINSEHLHAVRDRAA